MHGKWTELLPTAYMLYVGGGCAICDLFSPRLGSAWPAELLVRNGRP